MLPATVSTPLSLCRQLTAKPLFSPSSLPTEWTATFNILIILGLSALASPLPVQPGPTATDCWWMLGITLLLFPLIFTGRRVSRWEGVYLGLLLTR
jgi:hypothetical protein